MISDQIPTVSVIIPALNEETNIGETLESVSRLSGVGKQKFPHELR
jgi:cellulose synthase/poly-beta-1,6-N-acetylglucosamine synthase-like glycosyltransferase